MAQQTAVEWFADKMYDVISDRLRLYLEAIKREAKAMEREQIEASFNEGVKNGIKSVASDEMPEGTNYYNKTYKK